MITGVAFCPQAPALVPEIGRGLDAELGGLRAACRTVIRRVAVPGSQVVVLGSAEGVVGYGATVRGSFAPWGVDLDVPLGSDDPGPVGLPPSLAVGAWLVRDALGANSGAIGWTVGAESLDLPTWHDTRVALVVVGDGSAARSEKAPGYLDAGAARADAAVARTLSAGDGSGLHFPLLEDDANLLTAGVNAWAAAAWVTEASEWNAELLYDDAPFGVGYFVASWVRA